MALIICPQLPLCDPVAPHRRVFEIKLVCTLCAALIAYVSGGSPRWRCLLSFSQALQITPASISTPPRGCETASLFATLGPFVQSRVRLYCACGGVSRLATACRMHGIQGAGDTGIKDRSYSAPASPALRAFTCTSSLRLSRVLLSYLLLCSGASAIAGLCLMERRMGVCPRALSFLFSVRRCFF